jgi:hypothetical protein
MRRLLLHAVIGVLAMTTAAVAQPDYPPRYHPPERRASDSPEDLARYWVKSYLRRPAAREDIERLAGRLRNGDSPADVLSRLLGGREYYEYAGGTPAALVHQLLLDVGHHDPSSDEVRQTLRRVGSLSPREMADSFLQQYPQNWVPGLPGSPPPDDDFPPY